MTGNVQQVGGSPMVERWADLGPVILDNLRSMPQERRYRGRLVKVLIDQGMFTPEEVKGDKLAVAAITEKLGTLERQGLVKKVGQYFQGNQLWVAIGTVEPTLELSQEMASFLTVPGTLDVLPTGVLEERGHKYLTVKADAPLPRATTGGTKGSETVTVKIKYDPRWPHEGLKFSYSIGLVSDIRRKWRADFEKAVNDRMTAFLPAPIPKTPMPESAPLVTDSVSHEDMAPDYNKAGEERREDLENLTAVQAAGDE